MAYAALYRKLRPNRFQDIVGQQHIVKTLINQINMGRVSHAYLFCGTRGTGKTSAARLFAHSVNCQNPASGEPCNVCEACEAISGGRSLDVVEIDAASNNSVDNIRELREEVKYPPTYGKYKVYIIDEVHMLSTGAFNALLKTLEEPPSHVIFILATTDPQKIPPTIHSRCQRFDFRRISPIDIYNTLKEYVREDLDDDKNLGIKIDDDALRYIASLADGAMRDALSILEQCSAFYANTRITRDNVQDIVGAVDKSIFYELVEALTAFETGKCIEIISEVISRGRDITQFVNDLIAHLRNLLVAKEIGADSNAVDMSSENIERLSEQSRGISSNILINLVNTFSNLSNRLKYAANERVLLEAECIKLCNPAAFVSTESDASSYIAAMETRLNNLANMLETGNFKKPAQKADSAGNEAKVKPPAKAEAPVATNTIPDEKKPTPDGIKAAVANWKLFVSEFEMPLKIYLQKTEVSSDGGCLQIQAEEIHIANLRNHVDKIKERLLKRYNQSFDIIISAKNSNTGENKKADASPAFNTADFTDKINMDIIFEN